MVSLEFLIDSAKELEQIMYFYNELLVAEFQKIKLQFVFFYVICYVWK